MILRGVYVVSALLVLGMACLADARSGQAAKTTTLTEEERGILEWTNQVRAKEKLPALKPNPQLIKAAQSHSTNMARQQKMSHELDGKNVSERVEAAGYDYTEIAENIASGDGPVTAFYKLWLDSAPHRGAIVNDRHQEVGIGVARDEKGKAYATVVFGSQRKKP